MLDAQNSRPEILGDQPLITVVMPCYNSAEYMSVGIEALLEANRRYREQITEFTSCNDNQHTTLAAHGAAQPLQPSGDSNSQTLQPTHPLEIIIVDDGSTQDNTLEIAKSYEAAHPGVVRALHQENGGHGMAVMAGVRQAQGIYVKILDSDDQLDVDALCALLHAINQLTTDNQLVDLVVTNYVYCHDEYGERVMDFRRALPTNTSITWDQTNAFRPYQLMLMHALLYRTEMLNKSGMEMLAHTFYVDNLYAYVPLYCVHTLRYLDVNLYRYRIGRSDQSVNESVMISRVDHQLRVNRSLVEQLSLSDQVSSSRLRAYMVNYLVMMFAISTIFARLAKSSQAQQELGEIWELLRDLDEPTYHACRRTIIGRAITASPALTLASYRIFKRIFKFN